MSLFFEACELCKIGDIEKLETLFSEFEINIHEKEDLLLLIAAENHDVDMVEFLLKKGANPYSRDAMWFKEIYPLLEKEKFITYFNEYIKPITQTLDNVKSNLFNLTYSIKHLMLQQNIDFLEFFIFFVDNDYFFPLSYVDSYSSSLSYLQLEYLKKMGKFQAFIRKSYHLGDNKQYENEDIFYDKMSQKYNDFPYAISGLIKKLLDNHEYDSDFFNSYFLLQLRQNPPSFIKSLHELYPDFFNHILKKLGPETFKTLSLEQLKIILHAQDLKGTLSPYSGIIYNAKYRLEVLSYVVTHIKIDDHLLFNYFKTANLTLQKAIISQYDLIENRAQLEHLMYLNYRHQCYPETIDLLSEKLNASTLDIDLIKAVSANQLELSQKLINQGANVNFGHNSVLFLAINTKNDDLIDLIYPLSHINAHTFSLVLLLENKKTIDFYLKHDFSLLDNLSQIFNMENTNITQYIIERKKEHLKQILEQYISPIKYVCGLNFSATLFLSQYFKSFIHTNPFFGSYVLSQLIYYSKNVDNNFIISLIDSLDKKNKKLYSCFQQLGNFIHSDNTELLEYCVKHDWVELHNPTELNSMSIVHDKQLSEQMAQCLLSHIPKKHSYYQFVLNDLIKWHYLDLFNQSIDPTTYDFFTLFVKNFHLLENNDILYQSSFDLLFQKIIQFQVDKLPLLEEKACEGNNAHWKNIQIKIHAYYEQVKLNNLFNIDFIENEAKGKKKGKL